MNNCKHKGQHTDNIDEWKDRLRDMVSVAHLKLSMYLCYVYVFHIIAIVKSVKFHEQYLISKI